MTEAETRFDPDEARTRTRLSATTESGLQNAPDRKKKGMVTFKENEGIL